MPRTSERSISTQVFAEIEQTLREIEDGIESGRWDIEPVQIEVRYLRRIIEDELKREDQAVRIARLARDNRLARSHLRLLRDVAEALEREWQENHFGHCSRDWPHPAGRKCHWPRPDALERLRKFLLYGSQDASGLSDYLGDGD